MSRISATILIAALCIATVIGVASCTKETTEVTTNFVMPSDLKDGKIYRLQSGAKELYVVVVPYKVVSTTWVNGKSSNTSVSMPDKIEIDGKRYVLTEEQEDK